MYTTEHEVRPDPLGTHDRTVDVACRDPALGEQRFDFAAARQREQQILGLHFGATKHSRLVLRQQDQVVRLVGKDTKHSPMIIPPQGSTSPRAVAKTDQQQPVAAPLSPTEQPGTDGLSGFRCAAKSGPPNLLSALPRRATVDMNEMTATPISVRRAVLLALAAGLSVAAVVAIAAILTQSFDQTDLRLVGTSLGFSVFSALGAAGARAERSSTAPAALGTGTMAAAGLGFTLLLVAIWINHSAGAWRAFGTVAVVTLAASHACLVFGASRTTDSPPIAHLATTSVAAACVDSLLGVLAITGAITHVDATYVRVLAVLVIVMLLTTVLPPILRRLQIGATGEGRGQASSLRALSAGIGHNPDASELLAIADQLDALVRHPRRAARQIERHSAHLRRIAQRLDQGRTRDS